MRNTAPTLLVRTIANEYVGFGHLSRCMALAVEMQRRNWSVSFALERGSTEQFRLEAFPVIEVGSADEDDQHAEIDFLATRLGRVDWLLVDHFGLGAEYESESRRYAKQVAVIDGMLRKHDCDLWIDPAIRKGVDQVLLNARQVRLLTGSDYLLTDPRFAEVRSRALSGENDAESRTLMISFGGSRVELCGLLKALDEVGFRGRLILNTPYVPSCAKECSYILDHRPWIDDMRRVLEAVDGVIGGGGLSAWERCLAGIPAVVFQIASNQRHVCSHIEKQGAGIVFYAPPEAIGQEPLQGKLRAFVNDGGFRRALAVRAKKLHDGGGLKRIAKIIDASKKAYPAQEEEL